jgi:hypothetical protein
MNKNLKRAIYKAQATIKVLYILTESWSICQNNIIKSCRGTFSKTSRTFNKVYKIKNITYWKSARGLHMNQ